ncbi:hypothetical protein KIW_00390 [Pediococcus acidilactici MA18/5M]|nr:hypothetical protein KIW_00390 [Pediococcus acidilactici MA18/5M]
MISTKLFREKRLAGKDLVNEWRAEFWIRLFFIQQFILAFPPLKKSVRQKSLNKKSVHEGNLLMDRFYFGILTSIEPKRVPKVSLFLLTKN